MNAKTKTTITGKEAQIHSHELRRDVDAIMVGTQTALIDNPELTVRYVRGNNPIRIVLDTNRQLPLTLKMFTDNKADTIVLCSKIKFDKNSTSFSKYIPVDEDNNGKLSIHDILDVIVKEGISTLLVEGGAELLNSFKELDLIDEMYIYTSNTKLQNANLKNPLTVNDNWEIEKELTLGSDNLIIAKRKVECLQEL